MPFVNHIVTNINASLEAEALGDKRFQPAKFFGIAATFQVGEKINPGVVDTQGEYEAVNPDDDFAVQIYHKHLGNSYGLQKQGSIGDHYDVVCTSEMQAFVFAISHRIELTAEELETFIVFGIPAYSAHPKLKQCKINIVATDMDKIRNSRSEFFNTKDFLAPEHIFFSVRYQIKTVFDKKCVPGCSC